MMVHDQGVALALAVLAAGMKAHFFFLRNAEDLHLIILRRRRVYEPNNTHTKHTNTHTNQCTHTAIAA